MDRQEIFRRLCDILGTTFQLKGGVDSFNEGTGLLGRGIGLDSIEILSLVMALEKEFELTVEDDDLKPEHFSTVGSLTSFVQERVGPK